MSFMHAYELGAIPCPLWTAPREYELTTIHARSRPDGGRPYGATAPGPGNPPNPGALACTMAHARVWPLTGTPAHHCGTEPSAPLARSDHIRASTYTQHTHVRAHAHTQASFTHIHRDETTGHPASTTHTHTSIVMRLRDTQPAPHTLTHIHRDETTGHPASTTYTGHPASTTHTHTHPS